MWDIEVSEKGHTKTYMGTMRNGQIHLGKSLILDLKDGTKFKIAGVRRALMDLGTNVMMLDSSDMRRFRIRVLTNPSTNEAA